MIATHNLSLNIGQRQLIANLNWRVKDGECWSVIGRNGAGKSTLLRTLAGLRSADGGHVEIAQRPGAKPQRRLRL
jgi:iron complex transport system ATP-binding protein